MTVRHEYVRPAIVIEVTKAHTPSQISGIAAQTALQDSVVESPVSIVMVKIRRLIRIVRLNNVQPTIAVIIADGHAHAALHSAVLVHRATDFPPNLLEGSVPSIVIEAAGHRVTSHVNVRPTVVVEVGSRNA